MLGKNVNTRVMGAATLFRLAGFEVEHAGNYPGWKPDPKSDVVLKMQAVHEQVFGSPASSSPCMPGWSAESLAKNTLGCNPTIVDPHSPHERVQISTVASFWKYLKALLEAI